MDQAQVAPPGSGAEQTHTGGDRTSWSWALELAETIGLTVVIYLLIHAFVAQPFTVQQHSMEPTVLPTDFVLVEKVSSHFGPYARGDIVVFTPPAGYGQGGVPFIKRIIGLPGDTVALENGGVFVTPRGGVPVRLDEPYVARDASGVTDATLPETAAGTWEWTVPAGTYFVMGDNRPQSEDSRFFGPIEASRIIGRAWLRYFPFDRMGLFDRATYPGLPG